jgi:HlyD family type I secretion membrane fusion protein
MHGDVNPHFLRPVQSDEFLPPISLWATLGGWLIIGSCGVAVALAAALKYNVTVKAPGTLRPTGELRIVQAPTAGTVKTIAVKENTVVTQGEAIAILDDAQLQTKKTQLQSNIGQSQLQLTQIAAQIGALDSQRTAELQLMNRTIASARSDLSGNQQALQQSQLTTAAAVQEAEAALELARSEMSQYQTLANTGAIAQLQIKQKEQAFKAAQARLAQAKAALNPSAAPVEIARERIAQEQARGESTIAALDKERDNLIQRRVEIQTQLNGVREELQQIETQIKNSVIRAPESGIILQLNLRNSGQVVQPAEAIAQIAPGDTPLVIKARVPTQEIAKIARGQKSQMRVSAYPYPDYGILNGKVSAIAPDVTTANSGSAGSAAAYYEVTIQPEKTYLTKQEQKYPLQPGMELTADIISKEETVLTFILRKARLLSDF